MHTRWQQPPCTVDRLQMYCNGGATMQSFAIKVYCFMCDAACSIQSLVRCSTTTCCAMPSARAAVPHGNTEALCVQDIGMDPNLHEPYSVLSQYTQPRPKCLMCPKPPIDVPSNRTKGLGGVNARLNVSKSMRQPCSKQGRKVFKTMSHTPSG